MGGGNVLLGHGQGQDGAGRRPRQPGRVPGLARRQQLPQFRRQGFARKGVAGPMQHHQVGQPEERLPAVPAGQAGKGIGTQEQHQGLLGPQLLAQAFQGGHRIAGPGGFHLGPIHLESGIAGHGQAHHGQPVGPRKPGRAPMRRLAGGNPAHRSQAQGFPSFLGQTQVPQVHRVEGAPEQAQGPGFRHVRRCVRASRTLPGS